MPVGRTAINARISAQKKRPSALLGRFSSRTLMAGGAVVGHHQQEGHQQEGHQ
jgi:hypothetical protein